MHLRVKHSADVVTNSENVKSNIDQSSLQNVFKKVKICLGFVAPQEGGRFQDL